MRLIDADEFIKIFRNGEADTVELQNLSRWRKAVEVMNDLISRKHLLSLYDGLEGKGLRIPIDTLILNIEDEPTAYDPDKVVGELEELKKLEEGEGNNGYCPDEGRMCRYMFDSIGCSYCAFEKAIEIVRKGGVE